MQCVYACVIACAVGAHAQRHLARRERRSCTYYAAIDLDGVVSNKRVSECVVSFAMDVAVREPPFLSRTNATYKSLYRSISHKLIFFNSEPSVSMNQS